jgi:hypothetical protein
MNWGEAVVAMRHGFHVYRASLRTREYVGDSPDGLPIYDCGRESCMLAAAWTDDEEPVFVFRGAESGCMFVPEIEDREATDWAVDDGEVMP